MTKTQAIKLAYKQVNKSLTKTRNETKKQRIYCALTLLNCPLSLIYLFVDTSYKQSVYEMVTWYCTGIAPTWYT